MCSARFLGGEGRGDYLRHEALIDRNLMTFLKLDSVRQPVAGAPADHDLAQDSRIHLTDAMAGRN